MDGRELYIRSAKASIKEAPDPPNKRLLISGLRSGSLFLKCSYHGRIYTFSPVPFRSFGCMRNVIGYNWNANLALISICFNFIAARIGTCSLNSFFC